jgi:hypothetical protein
MIAARCYFDLLDVCIGYRYGDTTSPLYTIPNGLDFIVDSGHYIIPLGIQLIGLTAEQLYPFAVKLLHTEHVGLPA